MKIPYINLAAQHVTIKEELLAAVAKVIDHGKFILGEEVAKFERRFSHLCEVNYALGVNSGTDALILALETLGVGAGDEVITVPNSFVATAAAVALVGAKPVFVDTGEDYNINPALIEPAITERTKAILPVHLTGRPAAMDPILDIARKHGLTVIEDCAQAFLASYKGRPVGSLGSIGCFSLHPLKTLNACGDGGMLTTNDPELYEQLRMRRNLGLKSRDECRNWARNSRLDSLQAAILLIKLRHVETWTECRRANAVRYQQGLSALAQVEVPTEKSYERAVYHTFVIQADNRDGLKAYLAEHGVGTAVHYPVPIHLQPAAMELGYSQGSFPMSERQTGRILSLPVYPELKNSELDYIIECVTDFYEKG